MKICRFDNDRLGLVDGDTVRDVTAALDVLPNHRYPLPIFDPLIAHLPEVLQAIRRIAPSSPTLPLAGRRLLAPVANPGKVIAAPVNYKKHLEEAREQAEIHHNGQVAEIQKIGLFLKATSSVVGPGHGIEIQHPDRRNDHEAELVAVIGKAGRNIPREHAFDHIAAYMIGLDMTVRGPQERSLRKSIDTYSVVGPWLVTADEIDDPQALDFWLTVQGEPRQKANTRDLVLDIPALIEMASSYYTLQPGDLLFTGTPEGVGPVVHGDVITVDIEGIGRMTVDVRNARRDT
ncbi:MULTISPECIES: fumarylacetoacetate hydrolase family protein [Pseudomonadota]|jgi:2-keto-4-pentenoate hydratase/2-oxohepta-3-ene-1,7-dioic acid hydratase in catechol pathway|uniref:2-hydroxyhepta-2,4-diene-1,7-dioate isomerase n=2 Tax=Burkholderiales TaxID=80840 RepID=A0AAJ5NHZ6_9BURK|nr:MULTISPECIES: fumarylacetoacetate hydrolase family protein [Pseudomonadota]BCX54900.1 2-hydroxyhepta-2,4-diene-1,7-dioate isomerase [Comamonas testosteroni]GGH66169.1 2-hydroxyhepta-2,4-diene-1,7-dioate isomerase [Comamonas phosphati]AIO75283.1 fumarylacetoacetate (FAA) hydrolase family protein [Burkholderia multivorans]KAI3589249.1 putative 2-keto-4-pentenoate hydratase/2-oxohepta-3-ene-1,7-dioic acid hydratase [Cupriavidus sp. U2]KGG89591.1 2-hydroxyhepta-2,4-diene-1,7-dioate isomerase [C